MNMLREMTSMERVMTAIGQKEPDRVPLLLLLSIYGAREMDLPVRDYFSRAENVVVAQCRMLAKYRNDCIYSFFYAPVEVEAWGAEVVYCEEGPPNSGEPFIRTFAQIASLEIPNAKSTACLARVLQATALLKQEVGMNVPIIGVVMSPYSLPVMQMGFERYLEMLYDRPADFEKLMQVNEAFCVSWANAQLEAGATAICYFNPLASPTIIERELYARTGCAVDLRTVARIKGPTATHLASGMAIPVFDDLVKTGTLIAGISAQEDLAVAKQAAAGRLTLLGNLNGLDMVHWDTQNTVRIVREAIQKGAPGGGFLLSDNHGEIPWQVPEEVLMTISEAVRQWGGYPIGRADESSVPHAV